MGDVGLSAKECRRLALLSRVKEGLLKVTEAARLLGLSYRHTKRVCGSGIGKKGKRG